MQHSMDEAYGLAAVTPFERYRDIEEVAGLAVRVTVPDTVDETGDREAPPVVVVYELVEGARGEFIATVFRLGHPKFPPGSHINFRFQQTLKRNGQQKDGRDGQETIVALAEAWWHRRRGRRIQSSRRRR